MMFQNVASVCLVALCVAYCTSPVLGSQDASNEVVPETSFAQEEEDFVLNIQSKVQQAIQQARRPSIKEADLVEVGGDDDTLKDPAFVNGGDETPFTGGLKDPAFNGPAAEAAGEEAKAEKDAAVAAPAVAAAPEDHSDIVAEPKSKTDKKEELKDETAALADHLAAKADEHAEADKKKLAEHAEKKKADQALDDDSVQDVDSEVVAESKKLGFPEEVAAAIKNVDLAGKIHTLNNEQPVVPKSVDEQAEEEVIAFCNVAESNAGAEKNVTGQVSDKMKEALEYCTKARKELVKAEGPKKVVVMTDDGPAEDSNPCYVRFQERLAKLGPSMQNIPQPEDQCVWHGHLFLGRRRRRVGGGFHKPGPVMNPGPGPNAIDCNGKAVHKCEEKCLCVPHCILNKGGKPTAECMKCKATCGKCVKFLGCFTASPDHMPQMDKCKNACSALALSMNATEPQKDTCQKDCEDVSFHVPHVTHTAHALAHAKKAAKAAGLNCKGPKALKCGAKCECVGDCLHEHHAGKVSAKCETCKTKCEKCVKFAPCFMEIHELAKLKTAAAEAKNATKPATKPAEDHKMLASLAGKKAEPHGETAAEANELKSLGVDDHTETDKTGHFSAAVEDALLKNASAEARSGLDEATPKDAAHGLLTESGISEKTIQHKVAKKPAHKTAMEENKLLSQVLKAGTIHEDVEPLHPAPMMGEGRPLVIPMVEQPMVLAAPPPQAPPGA